MSSLKKNVIIATKLLLAVKAKILWSGFTYEIFSWDNLFATGHTVSVFPSLQNNKQDGKDCNATPSTNSISLMELNSTKDYGIHFILGPCLDLDVCVTTTLNTFLICIISPRTQQYINNSSDEGNGTCHNWKSHIHRQGISK